MLQTLHESQCDVITGGWAMPPVTINAPVNVDATSVVQLGNQLNFGLNVALFPGTQAISQGNGLGQLTGVF
jgi:hypothetical protein